MPEDPLTRVRPIKRRECRPPTRLTSGACCGHWRDGAQVPGPVGLDLLARAHIRRRQRTWSGHKETLGRLCPASQHLVTARRLSDLSGGPSQEGGGGAGISVASCGACLGRQTDQTDWKRCTSKAATAAMTNQRARLLTTSHAETIRLGPDGMPQHRYYGPRHNCTQMTRPGRKDGAKAGRRGRRCVRRRCCKTVH